MDLETPPHSSGRNNAIAFIFNFDQLSLEHVIALFSSEMCGDLVP